MLAVYKLTLWLLDMVIGAVYWFSLVGTQNEGRMFGSDANPLNEMHPQRQARSINLGIIASMMQTHQALILPKSDPFGGFFHVLLEREFR